MRPTYSRPEPHPPRGRARAEGEGPLKIHGGSATSAPRLRIDLPFGLGGFSMGDSPMNEMALQFTPVVSPVDHMEIWKASSNAFSLVITYTTISCPGCHGRRIS